MNDGSNWSYMLQDGLGSVRAEIAQNVAVNGSQSYAPYGEMFGASGTMSSRLRSLVSRWMAMACNIIIRDHDGYSRLLKLHTCNHLIMGFGGGFCWQ